MLSKLVTFLAFYLAFSLIFTPIVQYHCAALGFSSCTGLPICGMWVRAVGVIPFIVLTTPLWLLVLPLLLFLGARFLKKKLKKWFSKKLFVGSTLLIVTLVALIGLDEAKKSSYKSGYSAGHATGYDSALKTVGAAFPPCYITNNKTGEVVFRLMSYKNN